MMQRVHALPQVPGPCSVEHDICQVGASGEFGPLFGCLLSKDSDSWNIHVNLSSKELCLLKEENTPIAMNTNSFLQIVNFVTV
jgi:hypothetical protein